jgi:glycosyltransferase involved in cell wall biosynthesis
LTKYGLKENNFSMILARMEPENNIETILDGYIESNTKYPIIIFGGLNDFGLRLRGKYSKDNRIQFLGPNYNQEELNNLRHYSRYYFHGHSVGGTNPSLLEAMASNALIIAHNNIYNQSILGKEAIYFDSDQEITNFINEDIYFSRKEKFTELNKEKIENEFNWHIINKKYESFLMKLIGNK